jgi:hypothetical protein
VVVWVVELDVIIELDDVLVVVLVLDFEVDDWLVLVELEEVVLVVVVIAGGGDHAKVTAWEAETAPHTYVALTTYVPFTQLVEPPVTNLEENAPSTELTAVSFHSTCAPDGLSTVMTMYVPLTDGAGKTFPDTVSDCTPV